MISDFGGEWVLTGHSERRALCGETDSLLKSLSLRLKLG